MSTRVELTVRPRNATPVAPTAKPAVNEAGMEPLLSAEIDRTTSDTVVRPLFWISAAVIVVTGDGVSTSIRGRAEPVTVVAASSGVFCCAWSSGGGVCAAGAGGGAGGVWAEACAQAHASAAA